MCQYLKCSYTYKEINNIFLKFHPSLLRMSKIIEIGLIVLAENAIQEQNQNAYR